MAAEVKKYITEAIDNFMGSSKRAFIVFLILFLM